MNMFDYSRVVNITLTNVSINRHAPSRCTCICYRRWL